MRPKIRSIPLRARADNDGHLCIELDAGRARRDSSLFVVMDGGKHACRWLVHWKSGPTALPVFDAAQGKTVGTARVEYAGKRMSLALNADAADWRLGFVKLARPEPGLWVLDRDGWQVIVRT